jgi:hypothetical protein
MRAHWHTCITHFDAALDAFIADYFSDTSRKCLLFAGAGFDPRSRRIAMKLQAKLGPRLHGFLVREERQDPAQHLREIADENEAELRKLMPSAHVANIAMFDPVDKAPVGSQKILEELKTFVWPKGITDIVLDFSALSTGISFPMARFLLETIESRDGLSFHIMTSSNPELDMRIVGEPHSTPMFVKGFTGAPPQSLDQEVARIWLPQLASGRMPVFDKIRPEFNKAYRICPIVPFPARNPRRSDDLIAEFLPMLDEMSVDPRDFIYVSERNPLDSYRKLTMLKQRYDKTVEGIFVPELVLSPVGSKVMAIGALMAAIEHELRVQHVENIRYDFDPTREQGGSEQQDMSVHVWLHGPIYAGYEPPTPKA